ncbi:MAG: PIN domain-containing protein [Bryobacteraceae bacterium]
MNAKKRLVLDANILIRGSLGHRVVQLLDGYSESILFCSPAFCVEEARYHVPLILADRGVRSDAALNALDRVLGLVQIVEPTDYTNFEREAHARIAKRDKKDWPVVAVALRLRAPIWTEDSDFFGCGIATWTTDRVKLYLDPARP